MQTLHVGLEYEEMMALLEEARASGCKASELARDVLRKSLIDELVKRRRIERARVNND